MESDYIVNVGEDDFEFEVLNYSLNTAVVAEFWASWSRQSRQIQPYLEQIIVEAEGGVRLARVNVDQNPTLAMRFGVHTIPTLIAFSESQPTGEMVGLQPENRIREFFSRITPPSPSRLALEKANSLFNLHEYDQALEEYEKVLETIPHQPEALLGAAKCALVSGNLDSAEPYLIHFPASKQFETSRLLIGYSNLLRRLRDNRLPEATDLDITFISSLRLAQRGNLPAALDGLLEILRQNKTYASGAARQAILAILELMGEDDPETRSYRTELASVLF